MTGNCVAGSATQGSVTIFSEAEVVAAVEAEAFVAAASPAPLLPKDEPECALGELGFCVGAFVSQI